MEATGTRAKWVTFGVLLTVLGVGVAVLALAGGNSGASGGRLVLERAVAETGQAELLASVPRDLNRQELAPKGSVTLVCTNGQGREVLRDKHPWPWLDEEGYPLPHVHQPATEAKISAISRCRVQGLARRLEGTLKLRG